MCHTCRDLKREIEALRAATNVLRGQNIKLAVENNNLRNLAGRKMRPISQDYLTLWEQQQEMGA